MGSIFGKKAQGSKQTQFMLEQRLETIRKEEKERILKRRPLLKHILHTHDALSDGSSVNAWRVSVEACFVPLDPNEEHPLYLCDVGGAILVLFGSWIDDPHTVQAPEEVFENWDWRDSFFSEFSMRSSVETGTVFEVVVGSPRFVRVQSLPVRVRFRRLSESQLIKGSANTIIADLENAELAHPVTK